MKPSPLQLRWVTYPRASYEVNTDFEGDQGAPVPVKVEAVVTYRLGDSSIAHLTIENADDPPSPYKFSVMGLAAFDVDLERAREAYKSRTASELAITVAANVSRILFGSLREQLAMMTSRAPYSTATLQSLLIEPKDVKIESPGLTPEEVLRGLFGAADDEIEAIEASAVKEGAE